MVTRHSSTVDSATRPGKAAPALWISTSSSSIGSTAAGMASASCRSSGQVVAPSRSARASSRSDGPTAEKQRVSGRQCVGECRTEAARRLR